MPVQHYSPQQAFEALMKKLLAGNPSLAAQVQAAIDTGKDISETEQPTDKRKKPLIYRKTVPFSYEEALKVALDVLQAYFVEQPLFVNSAMESFTKSALGVPKNPLPEFMFSPEVVAGKPEPLSLEAIDTEKSIAVELRTETQISRSGEEMLILERISHEQIEEQRQHIGQIRTLLNFKED